MRTTTLQFIAAISILLVLAVGHTTHAQTAKLQVTVYDELGNFVEGAEVKIFSSESDYNSGSNEVASGVTDRKGRVKLKKLQTSDYFIDVRIDDLKNYDKVKTGKLQEGPSVKLNIVIS